MNRPKKIKLEASIHSGNYMTSSIHDQNDDEEMPIASPDATNEVPLNDLDQVDGLEIKEASGACGEPGGPGGVKGGKDADKIGPETIDGSSSSKMATSLAGTGEATVSLQSISGGLTLNRQNASLKNLISYIRSAYSNNLTSPKWKNFKGLKLQVMEKIRLNNVIWRTWFEQYGLKNVQKRKRPLICQFAISLDEPKQVKVDAKIDRSFWKKRLDSITNEYKKWRELSRRQNKLKTTTGSTDDAAGQVNNNQLRYRKSSKLSRDTNHLDSLAKLYSNIQAANAAVAANNSSSSSSAHSSAFNSSSSGQANASNAHTGGSTGVNINNSNSSANAYLSYNNNATSYGGASSMAATFSLDSGFNSVSSPGRGMGGSSSSIGGGSSSYVPVSGANSSTNHHNHHPIAHKQMPYRMRSPSPGLFQDFDLYNFSSDTLFSTYCFDDPKDPILGTNPDLFQPDLMHLYPTFDFLDIDIGNDPVPKDVVPANNDTSAILGPEAVVGPSVVTMMAPEVKDTSNGGGLYIPQEPAMPQSQSISLAAVEAPTTIMGSQTSQPGGLMVATGGMTVEYNDMADFNTLATVAAAQTISMPVRGRGGHNSLKMGPNLTQINTNESQMSGMLQYQQSAGKPGGQSSFYETAASNTANNGHQRSLPAAMNGSSSNTIRNLLASKSPLDALGQTTEILKQPQTAPIPQQQVQYMTANSMYSSATTANHNAAKRSVSLNESNRGKYQRQPLYSEEFQAQASSSQACYNPMIPAQPQQQHIEPQQPIKPAAQAPKMAMGGKKLPKIANKNLGAQVAAVPPVAVGPADVHVRKAVMEPSGKQNMYAGKKDKLPIAASKLTATANYIYMESQQQQQAVAPQHHMNIGSITSESNSNSSLGSPNDMMAGSLPNPYSGQGLVSMSAAAAAATASASAAANNYSSNFSVASKQRNSSENGVAAPKNESPKNQRSKASAAAAEDFGASVSSANGNSSRAMSRSNSYNSLSALGGNDLSSAEQKRRCNIQNGFDRLQTLVPSLKEGGKNSRASKAAMLLKTSDYIRELQKERNKRLADLDVYKREIEALSDRISDCQNMLPANGVSVAGGLNKTELFEQKFNDYIKERTVTDWKFYLFSFILRPLFDNFIGTVNTSSKEQMERSFHEWQSKYCSITQLRPIVTNSLRSMSRTTSIITDPKKLREECISAALTKL